MKLEITIHPATELPIYAGTYIVYADYLLCNTLLWTTRWFDGQHWQPSPTKILFWADMPNIPEAEMLKPGCE